MLTTLKYKLKSDFGKATCIYRYGWRFSKQMFHMSAAKFIVVRWLPRSYDSLLSRSIQGFNLKWSFQNGYHVFVWDGKAAIIFLVIMAAMCRRNRYIAAYE